MQRIAIPIDTQYLYDMHAPEIKSLKEDVIVYHGTSTVHLVSILRHGGMDKNIARSEEYALSKYVTPGIFVSSDPKASESYAYAAAHKFDGNPIMLEIVVPIEWIEYDPDARPLEGPEALKDLGKHIDPERYDLEDVNTYDPHQGMVTRFIPISTIRGIWYMNEGLTGPWRSLKSWVDSLRKRMEKGEELTEDLEAIVKASFELSLPTRRPQVSARQKIANAMWEVLQTLSWPSVENAYEKILHYVFVSGVTLDSNAYKIFGGVSSLLGEEFNGFEDYSDYAIKTNERLGQYFRRLDIRV